MRQGGKVNMSQLIAAIFENGVFRPMQNIEMKEHEQVTMKIVSMDDWQERFDRIIEKIHQKAAPYSPVEIESDITQAIAEVREEKNGH
jgi:predicted DNA-binding antitoxin AbrB/MazE fold protein